MYYPLIFGTFQHIHEILVSQAGVLDVEADVRVRVVVERAYRRHEVLVVGH